MSRNGFKVCCDYQMISNLETKNLQNLNVIKRILPDVEIQSFEDLLDTDKYCSRPTITVSESVSMELGAIEPEDWVVGTRVAVQFSDLEKEKKRPRMKVPRRKATFFFEGVVRQNNLDCSELLISFDDKNSLASFTHSEFKSGSIRFRYLEQDDESIEVGCFLAKLLRKFPKNKSVCAFLFTYRISIPVSFEDVQTMHKHLLMNRNTIHNVLCFAVLSKLTALSVWLDTPIKRDSGRRGLIGWSDKIRYFCTKDCSDGDSSEFNDNDQDDSTNSSDAEDGSSNICIAKGNTIC